IGDDRREARFQMVDENGATTELSDSEVLSSLHDGVIDSLVMRHRALKLETDLARHALPQREHLATRDLDLAGMHELHVAKALSGSLLDDVDCAWAGNLKIEPVVRLRRAIVFAVPQFVVGPEAAPPEQHQFVFGQPAENPLVNDLAVLVAMDDVLGLADV